MKTVVAEVNNTPWGERHCYVLDPDQFDDERRTLSKEFHVSPFLPMDMEYRWRLPDPNSVLKVNLENLRKGERYLQVSMIMKRREITTSNLSRALILYHSNSHKVRNMAWADPRFVQGQSKGTTTHKSGIQVHAIPVG